MAEMATTNEGTVRRARMNERVDCYVAERPEEGDQHASQGGIASVTSHAVPLLEIVPFDPIETAMRAGSSGDIRDTVADVPSAATPADQSEAPNNDIVIEQPAGGMDLDFVTESSQNMESCRVREKGQKFNRSLSEGSTKSVGVTLASGRVCRRLSEDARRVSSMFGMHRS